FHDEAEGTSIVIEHEHLNRSGIGWGRNLHETQLIAAVFLSLLLLQHNVEANQGQDLAAILSDPLAARHFHLRHGKLLEACQSTEWYGHATVAGPREEQGGLLFSNGRRRFCGLFGESAVSGFRNHAGPLRQAEYVQNERYFPIAHDA